MSKVKKRSAERPSSTISEEDIKFERIIQISGWIFLLLVVGFFAVWGLFDYALELIEIEIDRMIFAFVVFSGSNAALNMGLKSMIRKNRDEKKSIFLNWMVAQILFASIAILSIAAYQW